MAKQSRPTRMPFEKFEEAAEAIFKVPKREVEKAELRRRRRRKPEAAMKED